jgi:hypothetical protein
MLLSFLGGLFFYDWKLVPRYERQITHDQAVKKEMSEHYIPPRPQDKEIKK